ncbi:threonine/serine exporter family protein [Clostridium sp. SHJSY1]|uniref:threonine/serine exporter family protein n=1 Tax=Clostridium sp. SHJSY1 TaxID=2942483 RepID=UPI002875A9C8|nr:threonine/serine exporter family protein [Clostridium sp. SHJSY1]MDS0526365.1 threonine/serine exporter family protein [Clostridium sp. SHJSY1]
MIIETLFSVIASMGFGIIFNIKGKKLLFASLGGGVSWFFYTLGLRLGFSDIFSLFISSIFFSIYSEIFARILKTPVTTLVICCLIPLVPGAGMYNTMYEVITGNIPKALELAINTLSSSGTLVLGIIFVSTITRQLKELKILKGK